MLLQMVDGGITDLSYDQESWGGCKTCDYGSSYVNEYEFFMTTGVIRIKVDQSYSYAMSEGDMMKILLNNVEVIKGMTEDEFCDWIRGKVTSVANEGSWSEVSVSVDFRKTT